MSNPPVVVYEEEKKEKSQQPWRDPNGSEESFKLAFHGGYCSSDSENESTAELMKELTEVYKEYFAPSSGGHVYDDTAVLSGRSDGILASDSSMTDVWSAYDDLEDAQEHVDDSDRSPEIMTTNDQEGTLEEWATKFIQRSSTCNMSAVGKCPSSSVVTVDSDDGTHSKTRLTLSMGLPTFKPAKGCTDASIFIIRCFLSRLRMGMTVMKYNRSRWSKSPQHRRTLHISSDGKFLSWKPLPVAELHGQHVTTTSIRRHSRVDLSQCIEVRYAYSEDQQHPGYKGTTVIREKCNSEADAQKSLSLVFPHRTVDMTAATMDQCRILLRGFSALCYHLRHSSSLEDWKKKKNKNKVVITKSEETGSCRPPSLDPEDVSTTICSSSLSFLNNP